MENQEKEKRDKFHLLPFIRIHLSHFGDRSRVPTFTELVIRASNHIFRTDSQVIFLVPFAALLTTNQRFLVPSDHFVSSYHPLQNILLSSIFCCFTFFASAIKLSQVLLSPRVFFFCLMLPLSLSSYIFLGGLDDCFHLVKSLFCHTQNVTCLLYLRCIHKYYFHAVSPFVCF